MQQRHGSRRDQATVRPAQETSHQDRWQPLLADPTSWPQMEHELHPLGALDGERARYAHALLWRVKWGDAQHRRDSRRLNQGRAWIKRRDGWLKRLRTLRRELDDLYEIDGTLVATLQWYGLMKPGAFEKSDKTKAAFDRLLRAVERDPILTTKIKRPRGAHRNRSRTTSSRDSGTPASA